MTVRPADAFNDLTAPTPELRHQQLLTLADDREARETAPSPRKRRRKKPKFHLLPKSPLPQRPGRTQRRPKGRRSS